METDLNLMTCDLCFLWRQKIVTEDPLTDQAADKGYFKIKFISDKLILG